MPSKDNNYPKTVAEAVNRLLSALSEKDKEEIKKTSKDDLINLHFGLGQYIRNAFGLWRENEELLKACCPMDKYPEETRPYLFLDPDEASGVIIDALWERLRSQL